MIIPYQSVTIIYYSLIICLYFSYILGLHLTIFVLYLSFLGDRSLLLRSHLQDTDFENYVHRAPLVNQSVLNLFKKKNVPYRINSHASYFNNFFLFLRMRNEKYFEQSALEFDFQSCIFNSWYDFEYDRFL